MCVVYPSPLDATLLENSFRFLDSSAAGSEKFDFTSEPPKSVNYYRLDSPVVKF